MLRAMRLLLCASGRSARPHCGACRPFRARRAGAGADGCRFTASAAPPPLPVLFPVDASRPGIPLDSRLLGLGGDGYYWTPGSWARPPAVDLFGRPATGPGTQADHDYVFHSGYWAPTVGFYGGIDYRFGYSGQGFHGGFWRNHQFVYNRAVNDVGNVHVATYANQVFAPANHISYNGGTGGTAARPTPAQIAAMRERHIGPTPAQIQNQQTASRIPNQRYSENKGAPPIGALARANDFRGANRSLPLMHTVAGARPNGPFVAGPSAERGRPAQHVPNGPTAATGVVQNFAQHPVAIRGPTMRRKVAPPPKP